MSIGGWAWFHWKSGEGVAGRNNDDFVGGILDQLLKLRKDKREGHVLRVLIAGGAGSGKSTFTKDLIRVARQKGLRVKRAGMDAYTFDRKKRTEESLEGKAMYDKGKIDGLVNSLIQNVPFKIRTSNKADGTSSEELGGDKSPGFGFIYF